MADVTGPGYLGGEYPGGQTTVSGAPASAEVRVYYELPSGDWQLVESVTSAASGTWRVVNLNPNCAFHVLGRLSGYNDVIISNVQPVRTDVISVSGAFTPNSAFNGVSGAVTLVGGLPPYTAAVTTPLPYGLSPVIDGHSMIIDGTSTDGGDWNSVVRVAASNGPTVDVPVHALIGLNKPTNLKAAYAIANDWEVTLTWTDNCTFEQGVRVYRSTSPMDTSALPEPVATLAPGVVTYVDSGLTAGQTYYYRVAAYYGAAVVVSAEVSRIAKWTPSDLSVPPKIWLDWDSAITDVSGYASVWSNNKGSVGGSFTQTTAAARPQIVANAMNGKRVLRFDGGDDILRGSTETLAVLQQQSAWMFLGSKKRTTTTPTWGSIVLYQRVNSTNGTNRLGLSYDAAGSYTNKPFFYGHPANGATSPSITAVGGVVGAHELFSGRVTWSGGAASFHRNGILEGSQTTSGSNVPSVGPIDFVIGAGANGLAGTFADVDISCVLYGDEAQTDAERQRLEGWAAHQLGVQSTLPSSHPFKTVAP